MKKFFLLVFTACIACSNPASEPAPVTTKPDPIITPMPTNLELTKKLLGFWSLSYSQNTVFHTDKIQVKTINKIFAEEDQYTANGNTKSGYQVISTYSPQLKKYLILAANPSNAYFDVYVFDFDGTQSFSGCYYAFFRASSKPSICYSSMFGQKITSLDGGLNWGVGTAVADNAADPILVKQIQALRDLTP
jgi:hypothetical protein